MTAPVWIDALVRDFGRGAGIENFSLGERNAAAVSFENGRTLRFEWTHGVLAIEVAAPAAPSPATMKRLLAFAHPAAVRGARIRAGWLPKRQAAVLAMLLAERDATLPAVNGAFDALWRAADEIGGGR